MSDFLAKQQQKRQQAEEDKEEAASRKPMIASSKQQLISNPMIVNSQPYNPSHHHHQQQQQQQRCVGLAQQPESAGQKMQQNSLYGASAFASQQQMSNLQSQHMLDLANLQQNLIFNGMANDSSYDIATSNVNEEPANNNGQPLGRENSKRFNHNHANHNNGNNNNSAEQQRQQPHDVSLYSPSSSTSLLYHIYDQINLPSEQQYQQTQHDSGIILGSSNGSASGASSSANGPLTSNSKMSTTILNPANLFAAGQTSAAGPQLPLSLSMQMHQQQQQQQQQQQLAQQQQQQQHCYSATNYHLQPQLHAFNASHLPAYLGAGAQSGNLMLDGPLRQHAAATLARHNHQPRPLSSSAASSMSGNSGALAYGRQPRTLAHAHHHLEEPKGRLASVLHNSNMLSAQHLSHLAIMGSSPTLSSLARPPGKSGGGSGSAGGASGLPGSTQGAKLAGCLLFNNKPLKRAHQRLRHLAYEYKTIVQCSILLVFLAFCLMSIIKFTLLSASTSSLSSASSDQLKLLTQQPTPILNSQHHQLGNINSPSLIYPFPKQAELEQQRQPQQQQQQQQQHELLKSKLLIGEFVITSQNYTHSAGQKSLLAEHIVKLMDQVFLATDVRRVYSRMDIVNIRPNGQSGIVVDCNIILNESITYAAQLFGIALYESLARSGDRLANQVNYIIDKNSIRFNTVPDQDINSGIVPPDLISPGVSRDLGVSQQAAPGGPQQQVIVEPTSQVNTQQQQQPINTNQPSEDQLNLVVWSEWSLWSSCVDKNGVCDPARLHSRLRRCVLQHTGEKVEAAQCKQRFNQQDQELEVADCSRSCANQQAVEQQLAASSIEAASGPSVIGPLTAPSGLVGEPAPNVAGTSFSLPQALKPKQGLPQPAASTAPSPTTQEPSAELPAPSTTERSGNQAPSEPAPTTPLVDEQQQLSCTNCTTDEICLLLMSQKVPFCAKIKERADESGCGGWCKKSQNQVCQSVGQKAFKCIHDSECLPGEWRCHDSLCIPQANRCDGHNNCFDNSDERDCSA